MDPVGYSATPLAGKLGLKAGQRVLFINLPESLSGLAAAEPFAVSARCSWSSLPAGPWDLVHGFTVSRAELAAHLPRLMELIEREGVIWVSWPKKASKVSTDIGEDVVREIALPIGLVDIKVCAVDAVWSGLKLVIRKALR